MQTKTQKLMMASRAGRAAVTAATIAAGMAGASLAQGIPTGLPSSPLFGAQPFTQPMPRALVTDLSRYAISHWHYLYRPDYGSPPQGVTDVVPLVAKPASDNYCVDLVLPELVPGKVYRLTLDAAFGLTSRTAWYTLNRLRP